MSFNIWHFLRQTLTSALVIQNQWNTQKHLDLNLLAVMNLCGMNPGKSTISKFGEIQRMSWLEMRQFSDLSALLSHSLFAAI